MIRTYKHGDATQITPHFKASEFQCKCGKGHVFQLDDELVENLEQFFTVVPKLFGVKVKCINVSSGFRCVSHDKSVGGSGTGQHTLGRAADYTIILEDGSTLVSWKVCIAAQEIGFRGIARINDGYTHSDTRDGKWYGDETKGSSFCIPCADFYEYFDVRKMTKPLKSGIDISLWQDKIDWGKLTSDFVIIKAGQRDYTDPLYEQHYKAATDAGIPVGAYWYGEAKTVEEARKEADCFIERLRGKKFAYPVYYDVERDMLDLDGKVLSAVVDAFLSRVEKAGYWVGLYMSGIPMHDKISADVLRRYALWVADTRGQQPTYITSYGMWQYNGKGSVSGITGDVDLDYCYTDYPTQIKAKGLNGYGKADADPVEIQPDPVPATTLDDGIPVHLEIGDQTYVGRLDKV